MPFRSFGPSGAQSENNFSDTDKTNLDNLNTNAALVNQENTFTVAQKTESGVYIGGTAAANLLDDYEEGTWTPDDQSGATLSFTVTGAKYTKIGNIVECRASVTYPSTADGSTAKIGGLPFSTGSSVGLGFTGFHSNGKALFLRNQQFSTNMLLVDDVNTAPINSDLSTATIQLYFSYEA
jgi:hypothetical protein